MVARPELPALLESYLGPGSADFSEAMSEAARLFEAHRRSGDPALLDLALAEWEGALGHSQFAQIDASSQLLVYSVLAELYRVRFADRGDDRDDERAGEMLHRARVFDDGTRAAELDEVAGRLFLARWVRRNDETALLQATLYLDMAVLKGPQAGIDRTPLLLGAGRAWRHHFDVLGTAEALDRAIDYFRQAVTSALAESQPADESRNRLGDALDKRHQRFGRTEDLDEAEALFAAVIASSNAADERAWAYNGLGCVLLDRFVRLGKIDDLHRAIDALEQALEILPANSPNLATFWIDLGNARRSRYEAEGDTADLEAAIEAQTRGAEIARSQGLSATATVALGNLGVLMTLRYDASGRVSDLGEAIGYLELSAQDSTDGSQQGTESKVRLGALLCARYARTAVGEDLDRALALLDAALASRIVPEPLRPVALAQLGQAHLLDYRRRRDARALDAAIVALDRACDSPATSNAMLPGACANYAAALIQRHDLRHDPADLERAVAMARRGLEHTEPASPRRLELAGLLAQCLETRATAAGDELARAEAALLYREASQEAANPPAVLAYASRWARMHFGRGEWQAAAEAFARALAARAELLSTQMLRSEKEAWLIEMPGLSIDAAYAFAKIGDVARAVETIESGVAILLSEALGLPDAQIERLRVAGYDELATEYAEAAERSRSVSRLPLAAGLQLSDAALVRQLQEAHTARATAMEKIRAAPGFAEFGRPLSIDDLRRISARFGAPIVYFAVTQHGSLAAMVTGEDVRAFWPKLTRAQLGDLAVKREADGAWHGLLAAQLGMEALLDPALAEVLPVLQDALLEPVRSVLEQMGCEKVALVLTGQLPLMPVSAALLDHCCVQVEANGRSLGAALTEAERRNGRSTALAIGNPLPSACPLPAAELEAAMVAAHFREATLLLRTDVERRKVTECLESASHLHFACHGSMAPKDARESALLLGGEERLTVRDLLFGPAAPRRARLTVLSACQSAIPDFARLPDEIVGLPVAFLAAGVPGVVGTLWPVSDLSTALLMDRFYRGYVEDGMPPGIALRAAQRWLRDVPASELSEHFRAERQKSDEERAAPYDAVSAAWRRFAALDPATRPFASAMYWAAFVYCGA